MAGHGSVEYARNNPSVRQIVTTSTGQKLEIPARLGSTTYVKALKNGTYKVTSKATMPNAKPVTEILTEDELIAKYGKDTGKKLQVIA